MIELTINGHKIPVESINIYDAGVNMEVPEISDDFITQEVTFNMRYSYWNYKWLVGQVQKHNTKKAIK